MKPLYSILMLMLLSPVLALSPQHMYILQCQGCHNTDGRGIDGIVPRMKDFVGYFTHTPEGRAFIARVPGVAFSSLSDEETAQVLNWILDNQSAGQLPDDFEYYSGDEVATYRADAITDSIKVARAQVLAALLEAGAIPEDTDIPH